MAGANTSVQMTDLDFNKIKDNLKTFCICNGLLASIKLNNPNEKNLYTVGAFAHRVQKIVSVRELMFELQGIQSEAVLSTTAAL